MSKRETKNSAPVFFTICSKNLLAYAKTFVQSVKEHHPDSEAYVFLADRLLGPEEGLSELNIVTLEEHGGSVYRDMMFKYNITEFNTSIKPFCFLYLFEKFKRGTGVVYMDPDTWVQSRLEEIEDLFVSGADCVLTPHMTEPMGYSDLSDRSLLRYGAYNFGFVGIKNSVENEEIVCWWADELKEHCVIDYPNGLFVDQKYGDLFPSFFKHSGILRHPGYNIAYWNLFSRTLVREPDESVIVNGEPLRFLHFSGANMSKDSPVVSRHCQYLTRKNKKVYGELLDDWTQTVESNMHETHLEQGYSFFWNSADKDNEHTPQSVVEQGDIAPLERSHWMYMAQFQSVEHYEKWITQEQSFLGDVDNAIQQFYKDEEKYLFCNCCFRWRASNDWTIEKKCQCGGTEEVRLLNAFLYQELKLPCSASIYANELDANILRAVSNPFHDSIKSCSNLFLEEQSSQQKIFGLSLQGLEQVEKFETSIPDPKFVNQIIPVDMLDDDFQREILNTSISSINKMEGVRASLFVGMSGNHFMNSHKVGVVYLENTLIHSGSDMLFTNETSSYGLEKPQYTIDAA